MTATHDSTQHDMSDASAPDTIPAGERHIPVLVSEILEALHLQKGAVVVDCNLGDGGHSEAIITHLDGDVTIYGFDLDRDAIARTKQYLLASLSASTDPERGAELLTSLIPIQANFSALDTELAKKNVEAVDVILFDLGLSTYDLIGSGKGFTFREDEPLQMTFGAENEYLFTAYDIVNTWAEEDIANVIYAYGEEVLARKIARMIVEARVLGPITSSKQLAEIIEKKLGRGGVRFTKQGPKKITHPATKTFQALRIAVNNELEHLRTALEKSFVLLKPQGVLAVISYHSLEDRIVKQYFKEWVKQEKGIEYTKKPTVPRDEELQRNPRSRSAKLRIIIKQ